MVKWIEALAFGMLLAFALVFGFDMFNGKHQDADAQDREF